MANQYTKLTKDNILRKVNRKKNPVTSMAQLAREFGYDTGSWYSASTSAPGSFRRRVRRLVGPATYDKIRDSRYVNKSYR